MMLLVSILVFLLIAVIFAWLGTHLWARPNVASHRQAAHTGFDESPLP